MNRLGHDVAYRTLLDDLAGVHDGDGVRDLGDERQVVAHEDHREAKLFLQAVQKLDDLFLDRHVERRRRLVADDQLWVARQGHSDEHALTLAAESSCG